MHTYFCSRALQPSCSLQFELQAPYNLDIAVGRVKIASVSAPNMRQSQLVVLHQTDLSKLLTALYLPCFPCVRHVNK
jgi:hypothetical protein